MLHGDLIQSLLYLYVSLAHQTESVSAKIYFPHISSVAEMMCCIVSWRLFRTDWQLLRMASPAPEHKAKGDNMKSCYVDNM